jgi:drug/metabolite transporter (DMT)-like permease
MKSKELTQVTTIFVVLLLVGLLMIILPYRLDLGQVEVETALQNSLPLVGAAIFGAGLTFFLIEMVRQDQEKQA